MFGENVIKATITVVGGAIIGELGMLGGKMLADDIDLTVQVVKGAVSPDPVKVKKGWGKTQLVVYNPITDRVKPYNGDKEPVNNRPVKLKRKYKDQLGGNA